MCGVWQVEDVREWLAAINVYSKRFSSDDVSLAHVTCVLLFLCSYKDVLKGSTSRDNNNRHSFTSTSHAFPPFISACVVRGRRERACLAH